ncbi:hypothetical protein [Nostoc sp. ChiQUE01b]|uniref:hypothetical protein n=1 Tax=Nostoc sp. ChiQUE01b TaxID=3075376 RepID=UPI002AD2D257|nr:hypothetical protein [Nostoc sp. ChiQUE01b]
MSQELINCLQITKLLDKSWEGRTEDIAILNSFGAMPTAGYAYANTSSSALGKLFCLNIPVNQR